MSIAIIRHKKALFLLIASILLAAIMPLISSNPLVSAVFLGVYYIFIISMINPKIGLLLLILLRPCFDLLTSEYVVNYKDVSVNYAGIIAIFSIILATIVFFKTYKQTINIPLLGAWSLFVGISGFSVFFSPEPLISMAQFLRILSIAGIYLLAFILIKNADDLKLLIKTLLASTVIPIIFAIYQFFTKTGMSLPLEGIYNRIFGTFAHPNLFAYYLIIPIALATLVYLISDKKKVNSLLYLLYALLAITILVFTFTRGAWLALLLIFFVIGIFKFRKFFITSLFIFFAVYMLVSPVQERMNDLIKLKPSNSISWRLELWQDSIDYIGDKLWLGHGAGMAEIIIMNKRGPEMGSADPHNDYLKVALENGLLGLSAYLMLIFSLLLVLWRNYIKTKLPVLKTFLLLALAISISLYTLSFADNILRNTALMWTFWSLIGATLAVAQKNKIIKYD